MLFVGEEDRGYFARDVARFRGQELNFLQNSLDIGEQITEILTRQFDYILFDIEQYTNPAQELAAEIKRMERAKNCTVIIYAPGYDQKSKVIQELQVQGIRFFIFSARSGEAAEELERCMEGYYKEPEPEQIEEAVKKKEEARSVKIGITGACRRMGTTTLAIQMVKYLQVKGYKACYIEVNDTHFVESHERIFNTVHDSYLGKVSFEHVDMYYKQENLLEVLSQGYDYYVYDFGTYTDTDFNKTSFLEKDVRAFVVGSKALEMDYTMEVLRNEFYTDVSYVFNFISEKEKADLLEYMEDKAANTHFMVYAPDQFEYVYNPAYEKLLPVEDVSQREEPRKGLFRKKGKKRGKAQNGKV